MAIAGVTLPVIDLTMTFPTQRKDGTELKTSEIQSATVLRDSGSGPATLTTLNGPFNGDSATFADVSPSSGSDIYSFYVTDTLGTQGDTSPPVTVSVVGQQLAPPAAGTLTAVPRGSASSAPASTSSNADAPGPSNQTFSPSTASDTTPQSSLTPPSAPLPKK